VCCTAAGGGKALAIQPGMSEPSSHAFPPPGSRARGRRKTASSGHRTAGVVRSSASVSECYAPPFKSIVRLEPQHVLLLPAMWSVVWADRGYGGTTHITVTCRYDDRYCSE
jgi:hypothetical protein